jgi:VWFA-related protein
MRQLLALLAMVITAAGAGPGVRASQAPGDAGQGTAQQPPTFRAGTDLITVDVAVVDRDGRPVEDLAAGDFTVRIDGKARQIVAIDVLRAASTSAVTMGTGPAGGSHATVATNVGPTGGRRMLIAVDQTYIPPGTIKPLMNAAAQFVDRLTPADQAAFVVFPESPTRVDFTNDKARLRNAMEELIGRPQDFRRGTFNVGLAEARTITDKERNQIPPPDRPEAPDPPVMANVLARECVEPMTKEQCRALIVNEAMTINQVMRTDTRRSLATLQSILEQLGAIEGPKSLVLISASLAIDTQLDLDLLIRAAAAARTSLNVMMVDPDLRDDVRVDTQATDQMPRDMEDRRLRAEGLEELAADGRGAVYRISGSGESVFTRLALELSSSYILGVESLPEDQAGARKLDVSVRRAGARVRTSHASLRAPAPPRSMLDNLRDALSLPSALSDLPLRMTTFSQWDPGSGKVKVNLTAHLAASGADPSDAIVGYAVIDRDNRTVAGTTQKQQILPSGRANGPTRYGTVVLLDPGVYSLRLGVVDAAGRRGTVIRELSVQRSTPADHAFSDLLIGDPPADGQRLLPDVEPRITTGRVAAYLELYGAMPEDLDWTLVEVEIAKDADSPTLVSDAAEVVDGPLPAWRVAAAVLNVESLAPGPYVVRARIVSDDKTVGVLSRPFVLATATGAAAK